MYDVEAMQRSVSGATVLFSLVLVVLLVVANWRIFEKAGEAGWKSLIPFYNTYILFKITWDNGILFLLTFVPVVGTVMLWVTQYKLCKAFDKSTAFFIGMFFFSPIFLLILAFDGSEYLGPA